MTTREVIQAMSREQLEDAFSQREKQLSKALEGEKLARAGFDKAAAERDQLKHKAEFLEATLKKAVESFGEIARDVAEFAKGTLKL